jgi:hypothetical protein
MTDKQVDYFLKELEKSKYKLTTFNKKIDTINFNPEKVAEIMVKSFEVIYLVEELKLIRFSQNINEVQFYSLTKKGRKVIRLGGWLKYLERQDEIEKRKERKENAELRISEFQARNQHLPYIVSFCGVIISMVSLFFTCSNSNDEPLQKKEHTMEYKSKEKKVQNNENLGLDTLLLKKK